MKKGVIISTILVASTLILAACGGGKDTASDASNKQVLRVIETTEIPLMDTSLATDGVSFTAMNQVFEGLYTLDQKDQIIPAAAEAMPEISEDQKTYTIKIRDNAKWSDGSELKAADFIYAWRKVVNPKSGAQYSFLYRDVVENASDIIDGKKDPKELGVKALDDKTIEIKLTQAVPYFNSLLTFGPFYPQKEAYVTKEGKDFAKDSEHMLYNGPFTMTDWSGTSKTWSFLKNDNYWDKKNVKLDRIDVQVAKEPGSAVNLYNTGKVDRAPLTGDYASQYKDNKEFVAEPDSYVYWLKFNQKQSDVANVELRKAIAKAINKEALADTVIANGATAINGEIPNGFAQNPQTEKDFREDSGDHLTYNVAEAKEHFAKAKQQLGKNEITLELVGDDQEFAKKTLEFIQSELESHLEGLKINLKTVPYKNRLALDKAQDYTVQLSRWAPAYKDPMTYIASWQTDNNYNNMSYSSPEYDKLTTEITTTLATNPEKRWQAMLDTEKVLLDKDAAIAPLYQNATAVLEKPYVKGVVKHLFGAPYSFRWAYIQK
ncbi:peptide ABC transporter substrate-binding protein [Listeria grandensis]|uniref:Peptide ABC transporter substrate-binding protein n=1 Tax=Listeria grandensis TaxID=1494963 RepID=A0A7X0Y381_9LIST|nr:peptide ABC transporter substrate-binding protein [Listeria grandensis]MBC1935567.1 peptide ABC transporter substrate-binding protein [Listeria grandensis]